MASHVFVVDGRFRKAKIQVTASTHLSDVLAEGCTKLNLKSDQYLLKHKGKPVDLSRTIRLSSLLNGAQLDLVQGSRSPTVVSVALQLHNLRLTSKLPSTTSLWQILRQFETREKLNFTERVITPTTNAGAGRLFYEMPVLNVLNREFSALPDLQKTLSQLGVNSGSILLRLSFKDSGRPLEEAMSDITQYFKQEPAEATASSSTPQVDTTMPEDPSISTTTSSNLLPTVPTTEEKQATELSPPASPPVPEPQTSDLSSPAAAEPITTTSQITVYKPSTNPTPLSARQSYNERDYVPTIEHAQTHQSRLVTESRNKRLASDAELAKVAQSKAETFAAVRELRIRVRTPDQALIDMVLLRADCKASKVYELVRSQLRFVDAPFTLKYNTSAGAFVTLNDDEKVDLVSKLGWRGSVLVNMLWADNVDSKIKGLPALKDELLKVAKDVTAVVPDVPKEDNEPKGFLAGLAKGIEKQKEKLGGAEKEAKLKNLLGFGKKK